MSPDEAPPGNGLLLFFRVDDFNMALKRARALVSQLEEAPHVNPNTQTTEFSLRDLDGAPMPEEAPLWELSGKRHIDDERTGACTAQPTGRQLDH
jgi:hypothetical protein